MAPMTDDLGFFAGTTVDDPRHGTRRRSGRLLLLESGAAYTVAVQVQPGRTTVDSGRQPVAVPSTRRTWSGGCLARPRAGRSCSRSGAILVARAWRSSGERGAHDRLDPGDHRRPGPDYGDHRAARWPPWRPTSPPRCRCSTPGARDVLAGAGDGRGARRATLSTVLDMAAQSAGARQRVTQRHGAADRGARRSSSRPRQASSSGPLSCSQVHMGDTVRVTCLGTSSGAVVLVLGVGV